MTCTSEHFLKSKDIVWTSVKHFFTSKKYSFSKIQVAAVHIAGYVNIYLYLCVSILCVSIYVKPSVNLMSCCIKHTEKCC